MRTVATSVLALLGDKEFKTDSTFAVSILLQNACEYLGFHFDEVR